MNSISRSILARSLMTGAASLGFVMMSAAGVRAETVIVQGDEGAAGADGVNSGDPGMSGDDGSRWLPRRAACSRLLRPSIKRRQPEEMAARSARAQRPARGAMAAMAAPPTRLRRRQSSPVRRKRTPTLMVETAARAARAAQTAYSYPDLAAPAASRQRGVPRQARAAVQAPVAPPRKAGQEATQALPAETGPVGRVAPLG